MTPRLPWSVAVRYADGAIYVHQARTERDAEDLVAWVRENARARDALAATAVLAPVETERLWQVLAGIAPPAAAPRAVPATGAARSRSRA